MKRYLSPLAFAMLALIPVMMAGCDVIGGIIKGAFWLGVIVVVIVILLVWWLVSKFRGPKV